VRGASLGEQVDIDHEMYVGGVENITEERFAERLDEAYLPAWGTSGG